VHSAADERTSFYFLARTDPESTAGARVGWGRGFKAPKTQRPRRQRHCGWSIRSDRKQMSVLSKRHRTPVVETFVVH